MLKNIIFDCSDTLMHFRSTDLLTELSGDPARAIELHNLFLTHPVWGDYDNGKISTPALAELLSSLVAEHERHIPARYLAEYFRYFTPFDGTLALLTDLKKKGYRLYLLSDFPETFDAMQSQFPAIFDLFDSLVVSYRVGVSKRDGSLFDYILDHFGLDPAECLFVDDMPQNVEKAKARGMDGLRFTRTDAVRAYLGL